MTALTIDTPKAATGTMNPEVKAEWLTALRSGEFPQGQNTLCDSDGNYCCLGVLSELGARVGVTAREETESGISYNGCSAVPPVSVETWAGLDLSIPRIPTSALSEAQRDLLKRNYEERNHGESMLHYYDEFMEVTVLNDYGLTFPEIADLIEVYL